MITSWSVYSGTRSGVRSMGRYMNGGASLPRFGKGFFASERVGRSCSMVHRGCAPMALHRTPGGGLEVCQKTCFYAKRALTSGGAELTRVGLRWSVPSAVVVRTTASRSGICGRVCPRQRSRSGVNLDLLCQKFSYPLAKYLIRKRLTGPTIGSTIDVTPSKKRTLREISRSHSV